MFPCQSKRNFSDFEGRDLCMGLIPRVMHFNALLKRVTPQKRNCEVDFSIQHFLKTANFFQI